MAVIKKTTRKELLKEPDRFITTTGKLIAFGRQYRTHIIVGFLAVIVAAAAVSGYQYLSRKKEARAAVLLEQTRRSYADAMGYADPETALEQIRSDYNEISGTYSDTRAGVYAQVFFGDALYNAGEYAKAAETYEKAFSELSGEPVLRRLVQRNLAYALEGLKKYAEAAGKFHEIADAPQAVMPDEALYNAGRMEEAAGDTAGAKKTYEKLLAEYSDSIFAGVVRDKM